MCGIAGHCSFHTSLEPRTVGAMLKTIRHRGPDQEDVFTNERGNVALGFVRLAILDLSPLGSQPMTDETGRYTITFNGEAFNYVEVRNELLQRGYTFRSNTDTEVVLKAFMEWGTSAFAKFRGMWALAIFDAQKEEITFSRDYFGIKPLYFYETADGIFWASELKAFTVTGHPLEENTHTALEYLEFGLLGHNNNTFFRNIHQLPPAHVAVITTHLQQPNLKIEPFWSLEESLQTIHIPTSEQEQIEYFRELLINSINISLRSDVPVWVLLSGGLDSSTLVSVVDKLLPEQRVNTLTVVHDDPAINEYEYVQAVTAEKRCNLVQTRIDESRWIDELDAFVYHQDEPAASTSAINHWFLMKELGKQGVRVILSGQGVDEVQYGYVRMLMGYLFSDLLSQGKFITLGKELFAHWRDRNEIVPFLNEKPTTLQRLIGQKEFYLQVGKGLVPQSVAKNVKARMLEGASNLLKDQWRNTKNKFIAPELAQFDSLHNAMYRMLMVESIPRILRSEDRNSMAFSVEERVPFIDRDIMTYLFALPGTMKVKNGTSKWILREAMKGILPEKVRSRRSKLGFNSPEKHWLMSEECRHYLNDANIISTLKNSPVDHKSFQNMYDSIQKGEREYAGVVWRIINYALWKQKFGV